jgi:PIN domain nuclease of toxin-antitoxin system
VRLLLDTHALIWSLNDDRALGPKARALITDPSNDVLVSTASLWEIVVKIRVGKLVADIEEIDTAIDAQGFDRLDIALPHLVELAALPLHHRDPFDHLLIAQARAEQLTLVSQDSNFPAYDVALVRCSDE